MKTKIKGLAPLSEQPASVREGHEKWGVKEIDDAGLRRLLVKPQWAIDQKYADSVCEMADPNDYANAYNIADLPELAAAATALVREWNRPGCLPQFDLEEPVRALARIVKRINRRGAK
jgi:hypothetical protein